MVGHLAKSIHLPCIEIEFHRTAALRFLLQQFIPFVFHFEWKLDFCAIVVHCAGVRHVLLAAVFFL